MGILLVAALLTSASWAMGPELGEPYPMEMAPTVDLLEATELTFDTGGVTCNDQELTEPFQLPAAPTLYRRWDPERSYGTSTLVDTLVNAAEEVAWRVPGADPLMIGDMSYMQGGPMPGHHWHRSGIDADVGLFVTGAKQPNGGFVPVYASQLDLAATWALIDALLHTGNIDRLLLDQSLIEALRKYVVSNGILSADDAREILLPAGTPNVYRLTGVVQHAPGHRNHLHVRVFCG